MQKPTNFEKTLWLNSLRNNTQHSSPELRSFLISLLGMDSEMVQHHQSFEVRLFSGQQTRKPKHKAMQIGSWEDVQVRRWVDE